MVLATQLQACQTLIGMIEKRISSSTNRMMRAVGSTMPGIGIDAMNPEDVLGQVLADHANLHVDGGLMCFVYDDTLWHCDAGSGRRPLHQTQTSGPDLHD